jgi:hypothetical protein
MESEFVLEFVVRHIVCRNPAVQMSPLIVSIPGCLPVTLNCKSATIGKMTYERGRRLTFSHSHLLNLKSSFVLVQGHGDHSVRASCTFDFFALSSSPDDQIPVVYELEVGMDRPMGDRFGLLTCSFQLMPLPEFQDLLSAQRGPRGSGLAVAPPSPGRRISVTKQGSPRGSRHGSAPELPLLASRPGAPSIHDRYMRRNEGWIGNRSSTHTESPRGALPRDV